MQSHSKMWIILLTRASGQRFSHKQSRPCSHILIDNMLKLTLFKDGLAHRERNDFSFILCAMPFSDYKF